MFIFICVLVTHSELTCPCVFQIDPNSIAAKDGRIREGDRIIQVGQLSTRGLVPWPITEEHILWLMIIALGLKMQKMLRNKDHQVGYVVRLEVKLMRKAKTL